jgi:hypothetical protein
MPKKTKTKVQDIIIFSINHIWKWLQIVKLRSPYLGHTLPHSGQVVFIGIASCIDNHTINLAAVAVVPSEGLLEGRSFSSRG